MTRRAFRARAKDGVAGLHRARRLMLSCVLGKVREWFDGAGWFVGAAVVLLFVALLAGLAGLE